MELLQMDVSFWTSLGPIVREVGIGAALSVGMFFIFYKFLMRTSLSRDIERKELVEMLKS
jgi:hypothetical protein